MPQARKSARSSSRRSSTSRRSTTSRQSKKFNEPAALKRLNKSLGDAQRALTQLRGQAGGTAAQNTRNLHKGVGKFLTDARRDTGKFATALKRDFEKAQKAASAPAQRSRSGGTSRRRSTRRTSTRRTTRKSS
jgi:hypothetical protein